MNNFVLHNPTKLLFGRGTIAQIGRETSRYGRTVLLLYGCGSVHGNGVHAQAQAALREAGCRIVEHGGITPNPTLDEVYSGLERFRQHECEVICAMGGGSVIDTAKAISAAARAGHDVWKFFTGKKKMLSAVPLTCVSTLPGSGSESNSGMVLTNTAKQRKFGYGNRLLFPRVAILDPETTFTLPWKQTAYGVVDTVSHLVEYFCNNALVEAPLQEGLIASLLESTMAAAARVRQEPRDYAARAELMWCSSLAMSGSLAAGLGRVGFPMHLVEHCLSGRYDTPHGAGLSVVMPAWMRYRAATAPAVLASLGARLFAITGESAAKSAEKTASRFDDWCRGLGCPTRLGDLGIAAADIAALARDSLDLARIWRLHRDYPPPVVAEILELCR